MNYPSTCFVFYTLKNHLIPFRSNMAIRIVLLLICGLAPLASAAPRHVYLTWQGDTSTTITVNYQTMEGSDSSSVYYDTEPRHGEVAKYRHRVTGSRHQIPGLADQRWVHWVELKNLQPGQTYYFTAGAPTNGFTAEREFRTIPIDHRPICFVNGGDMGTGPELDVLMHVAAKKEPQFAVIGGDLAYANDAMTNFFLWDSWLDKWETNMVTPKGLTIPMVLAIGNHEVRGGYNRTPADANFYFGYFAQDSQRSYYSRRFGKDLALLLLDSGHVATHAGDQAFWLESELESLKKVPHRMAFYHVPMYPSVRNYSGVLSDEGRKNWLEVFDKHHLTAAFEHHDHAFKRTHLLRGEKVDPAGTLFLGDGCFGKPPRVVQQEKGWYHAKVGSLQHFWLVEASPKRVEYRRSIKTETSLTFIRPTPKAPRRPTPISTHCQNRNRSRLNNAAAIISFDGVSRTTWSPASTATIQARS